MKEVLAEVVGVLAGLLEPFGALVFALVGSIIELNAYSTYAAGATANGLWMAYMGALAFIAALFLVDEALSGQLLGLASAE